MALNLLNNRKNVVKATKGNTPVRLDDATARVAAMVTGEKTSGGAMRKKSGCKSCGGR